MSIYLKKKRFLFILHIIWNTNRYVCVCVRIALTDIYRNASDNTRTQYAGICDLLKGENGHTPKSQY